MDQKQIESMIEASGCFDVDWYIESYPEVLSLNINPIKHYIEYGSRLGYRPSPDFYPAAYLGANVDVKNAGMEPFTHYVQFGRQEGRLLKVEGAPSPDLNGRFTSGLGKAKLLRKKNIVIVSHDANIGGAPNVVISIAAWINKHTDYQVKIVSMGGGPLVQKFQSVAETLVLSSEHLLEEQSQTARQSIAEFVGDAPAFVLLNSVASGGFLSVNPFDVPIFAYIHEMPKVLEIFKNNLHEIANAALHIFCNGNNVKEALQKNYGFANETLSIVPSFIETNDRQLPTQIERREARVHLGLDPNKKTIVGCGVAHWRKQPDLFVELAKRARAYKVATNFVWVGDGEDRAALQNLVKQSGLSDMVHFVGHKDNFKEYLLAADIFALTSIEDPFPLVCLEAGLLGVPSVSFKESGATWTFSTPDDEPPAGISVPDFDTNLFEDSLKLLIENDKLVLDLGSVAAKRVLSNHSLETAAWRMFSKMRGIADLRPRVSIILPNFNCAAYLDERIQSIWSQEFKDFELIMLDDCSVDNSVEILKSWAEKFPDCSLSVSGKNSGSPFLAWQKGIDLAQGDLLWFAEADDYCDKTLLSTLVKQFELRGMKLAYAKSIPVDANSKVLGDYSKLYLDRISAGRWNDSYVTSAHDEIRTALGRANSIPNASSVVCRRSDAIQAIRNTNGLRLAGDWAFYVSVIRGGLIAFCAQTFNYHRRHATTITGAIEGSDRYFQELADVGALILKLYGSDVAREKHFSSFQMQELARFGRSDNLPVGDMTRFTFVPENCGLMYGVGDLTVGGAQTFAARFASYWGRSNSPSILAIKNSDDISEIVLSMLSDEVVILTFEEIERFGLQESIDYWGLGQIVTGHWWADCAVGELMQRQSCQAPWVIIMHGCYETVIDNTASFPGWDAALKRAEEFCDGWVWTAPKNKRLFELGFVSPRRLTHIVNGFEPVTPKRVSRQAFGLEADELVFVIASRAIEEKGWLVVYTTFCRLAKKWAGKVNSRLLMIGDGPVIPELQSLRTDGNDRVLRFGFVKDFAEIISVSDVCVLPSWFSGESLPLTVIEFLAQGKPAIVSDIGLCEWAIGTPDGNSAGFVVNRNSTSGRVEANDLEVVMEKFYDDRGLTMRMRPVADAAFQKFDFAHMIAKYKDFFVDG